MARLRSDDGRAQTHGRGWLSTRQCGGHDCRLVPSPLCGADSHVHEFYVENGGWQDFDLTAATGGPAIATGSSLANAMDTTADLFRVHYVGVDSHVHEFYVNGEGWHDFDITMAAGGPAVAAGSALANAMDTTQNLFRVNYVGADSHVMNSMSMAMDGTTLI